MIGCVCSGRKSLSKSTMTSHGDKTGNRSDITKLKASIYQGIRIPELFEPVSVHMDKVKNMHIRSDDILLCSFPKSGTLLLWRVLDMLIKGKADYSGGKSFMNCAIDIQDLGVINRIPKDGPRILQTHLPFFLLPGEIKDQCTKIVHLYRNPKDVIVSLYHQNQHQSELRGKSEETINDLLSNFLANQVVYGGQFFYFDQVTKFEKDNPDHPLLHVAYENIHLKPLEIVKKVSHFLCLTSSDELCGEIVKACTSEKQKAAEKKLESANTSLKTFRKGNIDDWKNHLTVAQNERIHQLLMERAMYCQFCARYIV